MVNEVTLIGRLGQDPDVRYTPSGKCVVNCSMATTEYYNNEEHTEWHKLVLWEKIAESFANLCRKGSLVYISGKNTTEVWEDAQGQKRYTTKVQVRGWKGLSNFGNQDGGSGGSGRSGGGKSSQQHSDLPPPDDDIPF